MNVQQKLRKLLKKDLRYKPEAYQFIQDALAYAQTVLNMGAPSELVERKEEPAGGKSDRPVVERHLTGQQLCLAIRQFALDQFGLMAKVVLNNWGLQSTGDFGEIVYNLISIGSMRKSKSDRREDFDDVFEFDEALHRSFRITKPE